MRAMILAAGYGTRLWPLTIDRAKPAIPFMGRPLVGYVAEYVARFGCRDVIVNLHHRPESVRTALGTGSRFGVRLHYVEEHAILGTSGALDNARSLLEDGTFIVINGKIATDIDLGEALETHRQRKALATLVLRPNAARERFSTVAVHDGLIAGFGPPPASDNAGEIGAPGSFTAKTRETTEGNRRDAPLMFTGIQILEPRIFSYIPRGIFSHSTIDVYPQAIARGETVAAHVSDRMWHELSTIERYLETSLELLGRAKREIEAGENCSIAPGAQVSEAVLWENVEIDRGVRVRRAVIGAGVHLRTGEVIENAAVVRADLVQGEPRPPKALPGEVRGANFVVSLAQ